MCDTLSTSRPNRRLPPASRSSKPRDVRLQVLLFGKPRAKSASRSSKPRDVRPNQPGNLTKISDRLTLFETAGCATPTPRAPAADRHPASRSSKPRDVRPACRSPHRPWCHAASRSSKPRDVRHEDVEAIDLGVDSASRSSKPRDVRHVLQFANGLRAHSRLTLFETAGCATMGCHAPFCGLYRLTLFETAGCATRLILSVDFRPEPPHALRNRGMCDRARQAVLMSEGEPPHALRNRGMCDW